MKLRLDPSTPRLIDPTAVGDMLAAAHDRHAVITITLHPEDYILMSDKFRSRLIPG